MPTLTAYALASPSRSSRVGWCFLPRGSLSPSAVLAGTYNPLLARLYETRDEATGALNDLYRPAVREALAAVGYRVVPLVLTLPGLHDAEARDEPAVLTLDGLRITDNRPPVADACQDVRVIEDDGDDLPAMAAAFALPEAEVDQEAISKALGSTYRPVTGPGLGGALASLAESRARAMKAAEADPHSQIRGV